MWPWLVEALEHRVIRLMVIAVVTIITLGILYALR